MQRAEHLGEVDPAQVDDLLLQPRPAAGLQPDPVLRILPGGGGGGGVRA